MHSAPAVDASEAHLVSTCYSSTENVERQKTFVIVISFFKLKKMNSQMGGFSVCPAN